MTSFLFTTRKPAPAFAGNRWRPLILLVIIVCCVFSLSPSPAFAQGGGASKKAGASTSGGNAKEGGKKRGESTEPGVRDYSSRNFLVHTDLPADEAKDLLERLETMLVLISRYWGRPNRTTIEMYVVKDLSVWPAGSIEPRGLESIQTGGGVTLGTTKFIGNEAIDAKAVVYCVADRGTPQHEAVHAYSQINFGRTGPTWYSEGMAEMGQYWKEKDPAAVAIHDVVFKYLKNSEPKGLDEIIAPGQETGDSWQNYAWRWALCHLLANNTNYSARFRPLGLSLLSSRPGSFEDTYGPSAKEINFEYQFFLKHMEQGYRTDLCSWDWTTKAVQVKTTGGVQAKIDAKKGWQASRLLAKEGEKYQFTLTGTWKTKPDAEAVSPQSVEEETGKLQGVLFKDYELSEPFLIDIDAGWTAPSDGALYLRCNENWGELADNVGQITVKIKKMDPSQIRP